MKIKVGFPGPKPENFRMEMVGQNNIRASSACYIYTDDPLIYASVNVTKVSEKYLPENYITLEI